MKVYVSDDRLVLVTVLGSTLPDVPAPDAMTVATREHPDAAWGPPVVVREERN